MKIQTRLRLNTAISLGTVILIFLSLAWSWWEINIADRNLDMFSEMRKVNFERNLLRDEYLLYQETRSINQWRSKTEEMRALLVQAETRFPQRENSLLLHEARQEFDTIVSGMSGVIESRALHKLGLNALASFSDAELRQISQVLLKAYSLADIIDRLHEATQARAKSTRTKGVFLVVLFILGGTSAIIINSAVIRKTLAKRLTALAAGVEIIGSGNLEYRIAMEGDDELTLLAQANNTMAANLRSSFTSLDNLQKEIAERKRVEEALGESLERFQMANRATYDVIWDWNLQTDALWWNPSFQEVFGYRADEVEPGVESWTNRIHTEDHDRVKTGVLAAIASGAEFWKDHYRFACKDGHFADIEDRGHINRNSNGKAVRMIGAMHDVSQRKQMELRLEAMVEELQRSNKELEQFAYVASHDLQEPLRMISSYTQLLADRYKDQLDDKANQFIHYAVDGAVRMQGLINDLLTYSRIGTKGKPHELVDTYAVLGETLNILKLNISEAGAIITNEELPEVRADASQWVLLFQNLIGNALKFRGEASPHIHIAAKDEGTQWLFSVKDNGIGIDLQFADKIFIIFQRLHTKEEYPGSGMGLAICKKIVERHGGKIWFESEPGKGTTFYFNIPK